VLERRIGSEKEGWVKVSSYWGGVVENGRVGVGGDEGRGGKGG